MSSGLKQIAHHYPDQIRLLDSPSLSSWVTQASQESCQQPLFNNLVRSIYSSMLMSILDHEWPTQAVNVKTRMSVAHKEQRLEATILDPQQKAVCVDIARAGMLPSQVFFDTLNTMVSPKGLRLDHVFASRVVDTLGQVTHTELSSDKIGGDIDQAIVLLPDPMGATGKSLCKVIEHYKANVPGRALRFISAHMIITPEFIKTVTTEHPDVIVYAARLDRGFSSSEALAQAPGALWDQEKGLNDSQYIVPGAGGVGELINNSFV